MSKQTGRVFWFIKLLKVGKHIDHPDHQSSGEKTILPSSDVIGNFLALHLRHFFYLTKEKVRLQYVLLITLTH